MTILHMFCRHCRAKTRHRVQPRRGRRCSVVVCLSCNPERPPSQGELLFVSPGGAR